MSNNQEEKVEVNGSIDRGKAIANSEESSTQKIISSRICCPACRLSLRATLTAEDNSEEEIASSQTSNVKTKTSDSTDRNSESRETVNPLKNKETLAKAPSSSRTRIGRVTKEEDGKTKIIDEADWEAPPDPVRDGTFAITLKKVIEGWTPWGKAIEGKDEITIVSAALQKLFRSVVKYFPGIGLDGSNITFRDPYEPLFFYFDELRMAAEQNAEETLAKDFNSLKRFYVNWVFQEHEKIQKIIGHGTIQYDYLWALFRPGDIIYSIDEMSEPCIYILIATAFRKPDRNFRPDDEFTSAGFHRLCADMWCITWDNASNAFQRFTTNLSIRSFVGGRSITSLPFYPLKYYKNGSQEDIDELLRMLEERGRRWKSLVSEPPSCQSYSGAAMNQETTENQHVGLPNISV
jgi:hypothetical protein